jgi:transforming growth factor-beta-induced protein
MKRKGIKRSLLSVALAAGLGSALALETNEEITILQGLQEDENFTTLVSLLESSGLAEDLSAAGDVTLFAPTNEAFETLGEDQLTTLSSDSAALTQVLQLHVLQGEYPVLDLSRAEEGTLSNLAGETYVIEQTGSGLSVNDGDLVSTDVDNFYSNGVVHVISNILVPAAQAASDETADTTDTADTTGVAVGTLTDTNADGVIDVNDVSDSNGDGVIDEQDYTAAGLTDTNGDGVLDEQDITATDAATTDTTTDAATDTTSTEDTSTDAATTDDAATTTTDTETTTDGASTGMASGMGVVDFATSDTDTDGFLSPEEFSTAFFALYDTDGDGLMSEEEVNAAMSGMNNAQ